MTSNCTCETTAPQRSTKKGWGAFVGITVMLLAVSVGLVAAVLNGVWVPQAVAVTLAVLTFLAGTVELASKVDGIGSLARERIAMGTSIVKIYALAGAIVAVLAPTFLH